MVERSSWRAQFFGTYLLAFVGLLLPAALAGCGHAPAADNSKPRDPELPVIRAEVLTVEPVVWPSIVRTQGSLMADEVTVVGAKVAGRVAEVTVDLGDVVAADGLLVTLDQEEFKLQVSLAEAQLLQARAALGLKTTEAVDRLDPESSPPVREAQAVWDETRARIERIRQLRIRNTVTQDEWDQAVAAEGVAAARHASAVNGVREKIAQIGVRAAELSVAQQQLAETVVHAPFAGLIQQRHVAPGTFVQVGDPLVTLVRTRTLRFRGTMPERHAHRLALGQQVTLKIEGVPEPRTATIARISPVVEAQSRSLVFEAEVENFDGALRTGLFAEAEVIVDPEARSIVIPTSATLEFAGTEKVWKLVDGVAREQVVQTARRSQQGVEIIDGLADGDIILRLAGQGRAARIEPITQQEATPAIPVAAEPADSNGGEGGGGEAAEDDAAADTPRGSVER
jgi:RND family efflux transporter MFP subunit